MAMCRFAAHRHCLCQMLCYAGVGVTGIALGVGAVNFASHPRALAPSTAASASLSSETSTFTLPFQMLRRFFSSEFRRGFMRRSPLFARPPKSMNASGAENTVKSASAAPSISPVYSNMSFASLSPAMAASYTSFEVISSTGRFRSSEGSFARDSRH